MAYLKQARIILVISFIGELIKRNISLPIPASIYGFIILFVLLQTGAIKEKNVDKTGSFLVEIIYKIASEDFTPGGITLEQSIQVVKYIEEAGAAGIVVSGGTLESRHDDYMAVMRGEKAVAPELIKRISAAAWIPSTYCSPRALYVENAAELKKHVNIPVITVCGIRPEERRGNDKGW